MGPIPIGAVIVAILFGSAMLAMTCARFLPEHHLGPDTKNVVSVSVAVIGTLSAIVVGLLISTSNAGFTARAQQVTQISADIIRLDRVLQRYGPPGEPSRALARQFAEAKLHDLFPDRRAVRANLENEATIRLLEQLQDELIALAPADDRQKLLKAEALDLCAALETANWQLGQEAANRSPVALLVLVMFWFCIIFASFGLFAPRNGTAIAMILLGSVAVGSAVRMTSELQTPFGSFVRVPQQPLVQALDRISR